MTALFSLVFCSIPRGSRSLSAASRLALVFAIASAVLPPLSAPGSAIVISGWLTNVNGDDSPYEYAQLVATRNIDFAATPHTVVWNDVGVVGSTGTASFSDGWAGGSLLSYAFQVTSGMVTAGEVFYVGGSAQLLTGPGSASLGGERWLRSINTSVASGDGLGSADGTGVFGNGGPNADGIAIFPGLASAITPTTIPTDSIFFGADVGTAYPATDGFKTADNDHYTSTGVFGDPGNAFLYADLAQNQFLRLTGTFNAATQNWETPRAGTVVTLSSLSPTSAISPQITVVPEPAGGALLAAGAFLATRRRQAGGDPLRRSPGASGKVGRARCTGLAGHGAVSRIG